MEYPESITIAGREVGTEEALMVLSELSVSDLNQLNKLHTFAQVVEVIYATYFNYGFTQTYGVHLKTKLS